MVAVMVVTGAEPHPCQGIVPKTRSVRHVPMTVAMPRTGCDSTIPEGDFSVTVYSLYAMLSIYLYLHMVFVFVCVVKCA